jgi:hypothetical protein
MKRTSLSCLALTLPLTLVVAAVGCGSDDDSGGGGAAAEGDHYQYVVATMNPKQTNALDIDGNGKSENQLGALIGFLTVGGFDVQGAVDEAVVRGAALLLADYQATSLSSASNAGFSLYLGDSAAITPAPCTDTTMLSTCGQHLTGTGSFAISAASPRDTQLTGSIAGGIFTGGPGRFSIPVALTGAPIVVNLIGARIRITESTEASIAGILGGAIAQTDIDSNVLPAIKDQLETVLVRDCGAAAARVAPACGCAANSTGAGVIAGFDTAAPQDCTVSIAEIKAQPFVASGLKTDIMVDGMPALSVGIGFTAKKATFAR